MSLKISICIFILLAVQPLNPKHTGLLCRVRKALCYDSCPMNKGYVAIIDYQAGNLRSVQKALEKASVTAVITSDPLKIRGASGMVFPGQGANDSSMRHLRERDLVQPIKDFIASGKPFLGVCLGLQLLLDGSDEGDEPGLGLISGRVRRLPQGAKVPHMGWNQVAFQQEYPEFEGVPQNTNFYFVHSYYADPIDADVVAGTTSYGIEFCSAVVRDNLAAVQFHPEKSGDVGLQIYRNFAGRLDGGA